MYDDRVVFIVSAVETKIKLSIINVRLSLTKMLLTLVHATRTKYDAFCSHKFDYACLGRLRHIVMKRFKIMEKLYSFEAGACNCLAQWATTYKYSDPKILTSGN